MGKAVSNLLVEQLLWNEVFLTLHAHYPLNNQNLPSSILALLYTKQAARILPEGSDQEIGSAKIQAGASLPSKLALFALLCRHLVGICKWKIMAILKIDCGASFGILVVARAILYLWLSSYKILFQQHFFLLVKEYSEFSIKSPENFKIGRLGMVVYAYIFSTWDLNVRSGVQGQL